MHAGPVRNRVGDGAQIGFGHPLPVRGVAGAELLVRDVAPLERLLMSERLPLPQPQPLVDVPPDAFDLRQRPVEIEQDGAIDLAHSS